jgi:hypothetical protein
MTEITAPHTRETSAELLISVATPSRRLGYHDLPHIGLIRAIAARIGEAGHLWGPDISFAGEKRITSIGVDDIQSFEMDSVSGEHVISVDAFYMSDGPFLGFRVMSRHRYLQFVWC